MTDAVEGLTLTVATDTTVTVIEAVPLMPSEVAVMVADPWATPETTPAYETVVTPVLLLDQVTVRPVRALPAASLGTATS